MNQDELEKTRPIKNLKDLNDDLTRTSKYKNITPSENREEKYKKSVENALEKERAEQAEEALAEKNIAEAEKLLNEEVASEEIETPELEEEEEIGFFTKIKNKWQELSKKNKIIIIAITVAVLILLIVGIILLTTKKKEEPKPEIPTTEDVVPTIIDNFYYKDGYLYFLKEDKTELGKYECTNKDENLCYVAINNNADSFDVDQSLNEDGTIKTQRIPIYNDNYVFITDKKEEKANDTNLYSITDAKIIDTYNEVKAYKDNYIIFKNNKNKYGLMKIDTTNTELIKPTYDYLGKINNSANLVAKNTKGYVIINEKNKTLSEPLAKGDIKYYSKNLIVTKLNDEYSVYNYEGKLLAAGYDFATVIDDYMALVINDTLTVKDVNNLKYNEGSITLLSHNYLRKSTYDEEGNLKESKKSFTIEKNKNNVLVTVFDEENNDDNTKYYNLDIEEAMVNKKYSYVNYFDRKLYFYEDEDKNKLIGTYACNNENYLSDSTKYDACYLANDTIFEDNDMLLPNATARKSTTPIIYDKYIFVNDGDDTIYLYDIKSNKVLGTYSHVNTYTDNNNNKITRVSKDIKVIAQNKKGIFGMLSLNKVQASLVYPFEYDWMEYLGSNVLVKDTSGKWSLIYSKDSLSTKYDYKIQGYTTNKQYFKIKNGTDYYVYDASGDKVLSNSFKYVELYSTFFAGVNNDNEVYIYDYNGNTLTNEGVKLNSSSYCRVANPAFKVEYKANSYIIYVLKDDKYIENTPELKTE